MTDQEFDDIYEESQCGGDRDKIISYLLNQRKALRAENTRLWNSLDDMPRAVTAEFERLGHVARVKTS